ncbi:MAG: hypothetical protein RLY57_80 [Candidatus Parcubacteria bacterium]|jgi:hypothetical protein
MEESKKVVSIIWTLVVLVALGAGLWYLISHSSSKEAAMVPAPGSDYYVSLIQVKHQFKDGEHVYAGSIDLPNACYRLDSHVEKVNDTSVVLNFETSKNTEEMCAQTVTSRNFRLTIDAPMNTSVKGMLNGKSVDLNVFEVPANQDIDLFEINIKG